MIRIGLYTGGELLIDGDQIDVSRVTAETIAKGLSQVNRFGGQTILPYSVAEHSVRLARWAGRNREQCAFRLALLLHDAPECLGVGDVQRFVKREYATALRTFDARLTAALWDRLRPSHVRVSWDDVADTVHLYDRPFGAHEAQFFGFPYDVEDCVGPGVPYGLADAENVPDYWPPPRAQREWMEEWRKCCSP